MEVLSNGTFKMTDNDYNIETEADKVSYGLGLQLGNQIMQQSFPGFSLDALLVGVKDIHANQPCRFSDEEMQQAFATINQMVKAQADAAGTENQQAGDAFLAENTQKEGVITTASGLQYEILVAGDGPKPAESDTVVTHYHGMLVDGTVFDSSVDRGEPAQFPVNGVIQGWIEALQMMPVGSKWRLTVPPQLAYGEHGSGPVIGPQSTLIFEVELLAIAGDS